MKFLYLHQVPLNSQSANIIQVLQMCHAFHQIGVDITLALPARYKDFSESGIVDEIEKKIGKRIEFKIRNFPMYTFGGRLRGLGAYFGAKRLLKEYKDVDACFVRSIFLAQLALGQGNKIIYESHGSALNPRSTFLNMIYRRMLLRYSKRESFLLFICISQALSDIWGNRGVPVHKILALHDGVSAEDYDVVKSREDARASLSIEFRGKIAVYAGSLYRDRGIENILRLAGAFPDVLFYVVGGPEKDKVYYKSTAKKWGLKNIVFKGYVPHFEIKEYLFAADILLMLWSGQVPTINICSPLKVFEYMAAERIIVGFGFPTVKEVVADGKTAFIAEPDSYEDLERKFRHALLQEYPNIMAETARNTVLNEYRWEKRARMIVSFIERSRCKNVGAG